MEPIVVAVVGDELAADVLCGKLRSEGIACATRRTDVGGAIAAASGGFGIAGPIEVLVEPRDLERARRLVAATDD